MVQECPNVGVVSKKRRSNWNPAACDPCTANKVCASISSPSPARSRLLHTLVPSANASAAASPPVNLGSMFCRRVLETEDMSSSQRRSTRLSLQAFAYEGPDASGRALTPSSITDGGASETGSSLGKRKRGVTETPATSVSIESTTIRRSPRNAPLAPHGNDAAAKRKPRRQPAKHIKGPNGSVKIEPPPNWEQVYDTCAAMRKRVLAPVDTMGCERLAEEHRSPKDQRLQTLVSLMLSSQTKDTVTAAAMRNLQENLPGGFTLDSLLDVEPEQLNKFIEKVGFHNNKTKFIKAVAPILRDQHNGDIPDTAEGLIALPGVGPKMAYLCLSAAWGRHEGIGVDVHVHRITNLWGWHKTSTPEQTRAELEAWLPREKWHEINHLLVGLGQTICLPVGRRCGECDMSKEGLCPSAVAGSPVKKRVKKEIEIKIEVGEGAHVETEKVVDQGDVAVKIETDLNGGDEGIVDGYHVL